jgi:hypothetical protein
MIFGIKMNETKKLARQKIVLTPYDNTLKGKIQGDAEHVHVLLDSTTAGFTVVLPDATATMQRELIMKNIGTNNVTVIPLTGQFVDKSTSHVISALDLVSFWSDRVKTWWMLDNNSVSGILYISSTVRLRHDLINNRVFLEGSLDGGITWPKVFAEYF